MEIFLTKMPVRAFLQRLQVQLMILRNQFTMDILTELETASTALDATKARVTTDVLYDGDVARWKRFGFSLLLRAGMRLSKVNPVKAAEIVGKAVTGGVMQSNADNAIIRHNPNFTNPIGSQLNGGQSAFFYLAQGFCRSPKKWK